MLQVLEERKFPVGELIPMASARSVGNVVSFNGKNWNVQELNEENIKKSGAEIALFSAGGSVSKEFAPICAKYGIVVPPASDTNIARAAEVAAAATARALAAGPLPEPQKRPPILAREPSHGWWTPLNKVATLQPVEAVASGADERWRGSPVT